MTAGGKDKAGPITLACGLIIGGTVLLLHNLGVISGLDWLWRLSPILLVGVGLEYFLKRLLNRDPGTEVRFSAGSLLLIILLVVASGVIFGAGGLLESLPWSWSGQSYTRAWELQPLEIKEGDRLLVDNPMGRIALAQASGSQLTVRALIRSPESGPAREQADRENVEVKRSGNEVFVRTLNGGLDNISFDLEVGVPAKLDAVIYSQAGYVSASDLQGGLDIRANTGRVELKRIGGNIDVQNDTGSVRVLDPGGDVAVKTESGSLTLSASRPLSGNYDLAAGAGKISFDVPAASDLAIKASSETGSISTSGFNDGESARKGIGDTFGAKLGNGEGLANLRVDTGTIKIRANGAELDSGIGQAGLGVETGPATGSAGINAQ